MKRFNSVLLRRLLATLLCLATVLSLAVMPISAAKNTDVLEEGTYATITGGTKLYLEPTNLWTADNAWFAIHLCNGDSAATWVKMTKMGTSGLYEATVPDGSWGNVIFCRMNPASTALTWNNRWNQTNDLTYTSPNNMFKITGWSGDKGIGTWSSYVPARDVIIHYKKSNSSWSNVYLYTWYTKGSEIHPSGDWPGTKMTLNSSHPGWYTLTVTGIETTTLSLIFNSGTGSQTGNLSISNIPESGGEYWYGGSSFSTTAPSDWNSGPQKEIYFDATLSKLSYAGGLRDYDKNNTPFTYADNTMPVAGATIYCHWWNSGSIGDVKMTLAPSGTFTDVYKCSIPADATSLLFYSSTTGTITSYGACMTVDQDLVTYSILDMEKPCFYADSSDNVIYSSEDIRRGGYWGEAYQLRDVEDGKDADVVDIDAATGAKAQGKYFNATFYDWYTDYELNGRNRDTYTSFGKNYSSHRNWAPFRHLNQALSDYYEDGSVSWPLYVGHFQPDEYNKGDDYDLPFSAIASTLDLYGYAARIEGGNDAYRRFFASNNSHLDAGTGTDKHSMAMQGLVNATMVNSALYSDGDTAFPLFNQAFIKGANSKNTVLGEVYENVQFPMEVRDYYNTGVAYYVFNSYDTTLKMVETSSGTYTLEKVTDETERARYQNMDAGSNPVTKEITNEAGEKKNVPVYGFFPFNSGSTAGKASTYNYGFGARFDIEFTLTGDGKVLDRDGNKVPIKFEFSGDDDVWVFIDDKLVLDIGGAHSAVTGTIDFSTLTATVNQVKYSGPGTDQYIPCVTSFQMNRSGKHTLTMFYMERGMAESNMELVFNIANSYPATLNVTKEVVGDADPDQFYTMNVTLENAETHKMEPVAVGTEYTVGSEIRTVQTAGQLLLKGGETATIVGIPAGTEYEVKEATGNYLTTFFGKASDNSTVTTSNTSASGTLEEATVHTVTVVNIVTQDTVVIDYGIPTSVNVADSTYATLYSLYSVNDSAWISKPTSVSSPTNGTYGTAKLESGKIVYTPSNMKMAGVDKIGYVIKYVRDGKTLYYNGTLTVVPAATIYYEDNFVTFNGNWGEKTVPSVTQAEDRPGTGNAYDANNVYGYDGAYSSSTTHSLGSARCTTVSAANGSNPPTATFTFTGTGFDLIGVTSNRTGFATCKVYKGTQTTGDAAKSWAVDTYYGYTAEQSGFIKYTWTYNGEDWSVKTDVVNTPGNDATKVMPEEPYQKGTTVILYEENYIWTATTGEANPLYQIPVIKSPKLDYGTYTVVITPLYAPFFDHTNDGKDNYDFYIDAVRIYNPAQNMEDYYKLDGEAYPQYIELRQPLVNSTETQTGISIIDGISGGTITEYKEFGPNNEIYLNSGHAVAFTLNASGTIANVHVGAKIFSDNGTLKYSVIRNKNEVATGTINLTSHTDMYYTISEKVIPASGDMIILSNTGNKTLTLTTLKITYTSAPSAKATLTTNTDNTKSAAKYVNALIGSMIDLEIRPLNVHIAHSVSFESDLQLNYRIMQEDLAGYDLNSAYLVVEKDVYPSRGEPSVETYVLYPDLTSDPQRMIFHLAGIKSVEMGSELRATLHIKDELGRKYETAVDVYSILAYAQACFNKYSYEEYPAFYSLLIDTLNYGAAAQSYFGRRTDSLVNAGLDAYQQYATKDFAEELTATKVLLDNTNKGLVSKVNFSIDFADRTAMKVKLTLSGSAEEITSVQVTDEEGNTVASLTEFETLADGRIQVTYDGIRAMEMRRMYYFTAYSGEEAASATAGYSVEAYVRSNLGTSLPGLSDLVRYCMYYGDSAYNYFTQRGGESK